MQTSGLLHIQKYRFNALFVHWKITYTIHSYIFVSDFFSDHFKTNRCFSIAEK